MARSAKMMAAALVVLAMTVATAEARSIKTAEKKDDTVVQPQTFPPFDRLGGSSIMPGSGSSIPGSSIPGFGGMPGSGGSSMPGFSMPGSGGLTPGFSLPGSGVIGSMPLFGGSPFSGFGGMPGSPAAGSVPEHAQKP